MQQIWIFRIILMSLFSLLNGLLSKNADHLSVLNIARQVRQDLTRRVTFLAMNSDPELEAIQEQSDAGVQTLNHSGWRCFGSSATQRLIPWFSANCEFNWLPNLVLMASQETISHALECSPFMTLAQYLWSKGSTVIPIFCRTTMVIMYVRKYAKRWKRILISIFIVFVSFSLGTISEYMQCGML